jgi:6-pyruvoyltetrahydropterin/6-carboxytetrahydropterin synthase
MPIRTATLTRQIRFGLHEPPRGITSNSFAANPPVTGIEPFLMLTVHLHGPIDPQTGMLINIVEIDTTLREVAITHLRKYHATPHKLPVWSAVAALQQRLVGEWPTLQLTQLHLHLTPLLSVSAVAKDDRMVQVSQRFEFAASHRLYTKTLSPEKNLALFGRCTNANGHGHNYEIEITLNVPTTTTESNVITTLQNVVGKWVIDRFDHKHLNLDCPEFATLNPTVENIAAVIFDLLADHFDHGLSLARVRVWETPKTSAEVTAESRHADVAAR